LYKIKKDFFAASKLISLAFFRILFSERFATGTQSSNAAFPMAL
jgi:hypothetical protein